MLVFSLGSGIGLAHERECDFRLRRVFPRVERDVFVQPTSSAQRVRNTKDARGEEEIFSTDNDIDF